MVEQKLGLQPIWIKVRRRWRFSHRSRMVRLLGVVRTRHQVGASNVCHSQAAASTQATTWGERTVTVDQTSSVKFPRTEQKPRGEHTLLKTMLMITILFTVSWCPNNVYFFLLSVDRSGNFSMTSDVWYASLFIAFLSQCLQPFIYGAALKNVRMYMKHFIR